MNRLDRYIRAFSIAAIILLVVLTIYFGAYVGRARRVGGFGDPLTGQVFAGCSYDFEWEARFFAPAAMMEAIVCQRNMVTGTRDGVVWRSSNKPAVKPNGNVQPADQSR